jgi:hypothetical protein
VADHRIFLRIIPVNIRGSKRVGRGCLEQEEVWLVPDFGVTLHG